MPGSWLEVSDRLKFTKPPHGDLLWFNESMSVRLIDETSGVTSYTSSTAATTIASLVAPANSLSNGGAVRFQAGGTVLAPSTGTLVLTLKGAVAGSTSTLLATTGITLSTSTSPRSWEVAGVLYGQQPGQQHALGAVRVSAPSTGTLAPTSYESVGRSTAGFDETLQYTMSLVSQVSSTEITVTRHVGLLETMGG